MARAAAYPVIEQPHPRIEEGGVAETVVLRAPAPASVRNVDGVTSTAVIGPAGRAEAGSRDGSVVTAEADGALGIETAEGVRPVVAGPVVGP